MANLTEANSWEAGIYQLELTDPVVGGPDGLSNRQAKQLANRTLYLKNLVDALGLGKQPLDATLTALAGMVTAANQLIYATGADTFATTPLSAFIRTLLDDADAATARATLGAQASDATLTALAGVVTAANQLIYATGPATFATTSLSAFIRTLLDDADAAAARTTLGAAPLASPGFTGTPTAPTAALGTNTTQVATMAALKEAIANLLDSAPGALDTLNELAAALGDDPNFAATMTNALAGKQPMDATLTALAGVVTAANQLIYATGADTFATTSLSAFIRTLLDDADAATARTTLGAAPLASPAFTGTPTVPTAAAGTNTTQAASTAFVQDATAQMTVSHVVAQNTAVAGIVGVNTRPLNTVDCNTISGASLSSNQVTLPAGKYLIDGWSTCVGNIIKNYLYNVTAGAVAILGSGEYNAGGGADNHQGYISGVITLAAPAVFEVRHQITSVSSTSYVLGRPVNLTGAEVYASFTFRRIS